MKELNKTVITIINATNTTMGDHDQRSAIGIARSTLEPTYKPVKTDPFLAKEFANRDKLAAELVETIKDVKYGDAKAALAAGRAHINRPFVDAAMIGFQAARSRAGAVGSDKKNDKMGL